LSFGMENGRNDHRIGFARRGKKAKAYMRPIWRELNQ
jgi:hypothetical protein